MCGFVGFKNTPEVASPQNVIKAMADRIIHRGPDDADYYVDDQVSLGFRRLSIIDLEGGRQPILNEDGMNISQGQKQLLTIARAMLLDAKMLILDEATSNVDTRTEIQIQEAMRALMKDKTCFVIAHRLSTIQNADTLLVVQDGEIVEQGNHHELMKRGGVYAGLYQSQFQ